MRTPKVDKLTVHIGVGESGENLNNAEEILKTIAKQQGVRTKAKRTLLAFSIKKHEPIGCKVILRGELAENFLKTGLGIIENELKESQFDDTGNFSFGIEEHTDFPEMRYDPNIGIFGMDVTVSLIRPGYRVARRKIQKQKIPNSHKITKQDAIAFIKDSYGVEVLA
ncbi:MAG: 50S ribosomal protein L5 [ANME-2 cluster archaeon]|nr:50S ribosomal protein L5 [ANME-2 cluster archaeon]